MILKNDVSVKKKRKNSSLMMLIVIGGSPEIKDEALFPVNVFLVEISPLNGER